MGTITSESNSPTRPVWSIHPVQFRDAFQKSIQQTVNNSLDAVVQMSNGAIDGRYLMSEPVAVTNISNEEGYYYHMVGESVMGDLTVAAP